MSQRAVVAPRAAVTAAPAPAVLIDVNPALAAEWLEKNKNNPKIRRVDRDTVARYASDMAAVPSRWTIPEAVIGFDTNGVMINGYHRCRAIVDSGVTVRMFVAHGLPPETVDNMDTGRRRTLSDQLTMSEYPHAFALSSSSRLALAWVTGRLGRRIAGVSDAEVREFVANHPSMLDAASFAALTRSPLTLSVTGATTWRLVDMGYPEKDVREFFRSIAELRTDDKEGCPKRALLHRVTRGRAARERFRPVELLSMTVRAWNAVRANTLIKKMQTSAIVPDIAPVNRST